MQLNKRIKILAELGKRLDIETEKVQNVVESAVLHNGWFTASNVKKALLAIKNNYLDEAALLEFAGYYKVDTVNENVKTVGLVMAGNIPLVGFQDLIYVLLTGNKAQIKISSKDTFLSEFIFEELRGIEPGMNNFISVQERLADFDAIIATGSNNSSRYFDYYFSKYPNIIRKNRNSVAVLNGNETDDDLKNLSKDVFSYFGLGCRNVSSVLVPEGYDFIPLLQCFETEEPDIKHHHKFKNNYDYQLSLLLINGVPHLASENLLVKEDSQIASPIACLHYQQYKDDTFINDFLKNNEALIQCIVSNNKNIGAVGFGESQLPGLKDFADNIDVMDFLLNNSN